MKVDASSGRNRRTAEISGARISSTSGLPFEDRAKAVLHYHGDPQVRTESFQNVERGGGEHAIAEGPQPDDRRRDCRPAEMRGRSPRAPLLFDLSLVDQHHRNLVTDRVHPMALDAPEPELSAFSSTTALQMRADENFQQFLADSHSERPV